MSQSIGNYDIDNVEAYQFSPHTLRVNRRLVNELRDYEAR